MRSPGESRGEWRRSTSGPPPSPRPSSSRSTLSTPNAVVFAASFATIFATTFFLGAFLCHQIAGERSPRIWESAALGLFALALGSYEAAAVLPLLLVAHDLLIEPGDRGRPLRARLLRWLPYGGLLGLYFLLRRHLFGVFLGGYEETGRRLLAPQLRQLLGDLGQSLYQLHVPVFAQSPGRFAPLLFLLLAGLLPLLYLGLSPVRRGSLRPWLFGWVWTIVSLAPFAFRPVVPGNGRYWYLAAIGAALAAAFLARALAAAWQGSWRVLPALAVLALLVWWGFLLTGYLQVYVEAGRTAQSLAMQLERALRRPGGAPVFVAGSPSFLLNAAGLPVAPVYHYGLSDAVSPPFAPPSPPVYPLPPLAVEELRPLLAGRPTSRIYEWEAGSGTLRQVVLSPFVLLSELPVLAPADGARLGQECAVGNFPPGSRAALPARRPRPRQPERHGLHRRPVPERHAPRRSPARLPPRHGPPLRRRLLLVDRIAGRARAAPLEPDALLLARPG